MAGRFYTGCAVWGHTPWVGGLYPRGTPQREFLNVYAQRLTAVEGNTTFHAMPSAANVARWATQVGETFRFLPKIHRSISHEGDLAGKGHSAQAFIELMQAGLGPRCGPFFLQLPPSYGPDRMSDLTRFLGRWPSQVPLALEVRDLAWFRRGNLAQLDATLRRFSVSRVLLDTNPCYRAPDNPMATAVRVKPDLPVEASVTTDFVLVRYIGHPVPERNEDFLSAWAERVCRWLRGGVDVYFMLHCPIEDHSPALALRFHALLTALDPSVPPLPWAHAPGQMALL